MKTPYHSIEQSDIDYAMSPTPWDLGNQVLYDLCSLHPQHKTHEEAIAKIWLIGRSYSAAIERRKNKGDVDGDDFYEKIVGPKLSESNIDTLLSDLPDKPADPVANVAQGVRIHKKTTDLFRDISGMGKRSLSSKYLHFHRPDMFFIYDSRADGAIGKLTPDVRHVDCVEVLPNERDEWYYRFCMRTCWLRTKIEEDYGQTLTPRQIDKVLLSAHTRISDRKP